jgi:hypothetical protein
VVPVRCDSSRDGPWCLGVEPSPVPDRSAALRSRARDFHEELDCQSRGSPVRRFDLAVSSFASKHGDEHGHGATRASGHPRGRHARRHPCCGGPGYTSVGCWAPSSCSSGRPRWGSAGSGSRGPRRHATITVRRQRPQASRNSQPSATRRHLHRAVKGPAAATEAPRPLREEQCEEALRSQRGSAAPHLGGGGSVPYHAAAQ